MSRPQDPSEHPNAGAYEQTRIGVPLPDLSGSDAGVSGFSPVPDSQPAVDARPTQPPAPQRPMPPVPGPAPAQYGQPPIAPPVPAAPYGGPTPFGQPPFYGQPTPYGAPVPPQLPYGAPVPPRRSTGKTFALVCSVVAVVGVVAGLLVWQPWSSSSDADQARTETFELDHSYQLRITVPAGWHAYDDNSEGIRGPVILPRDDDRTYAQITDDLKRIDDGGSAEPVHTITVTAQPCAASDAGSTAGEWKWDTNDVTDQPGRTIVAAAGVTPLDSGICLVASAVDGSTGSAAETPAQDLVREMVAKNQLSAAKAT